jgi:hypothetical protein
MDEVQILVSGGGCLSSTGSAEAAALQHQLATGMAISTLLEGRLVMISDWLPGLHWRIQVSQQFADTLPGMAVAAIWNSVEPQLTRWLDQSADAEVFVLPPQWGECALVPSVYHWSPEPVAFTLRCRWSPSLTPKVR